jgi:hypothetical protein
MGLDLERQSPNGVALATRLVLQLRESAATRAGMHAAPHGVARSVVGCARPCRDGKRWLDMLLNHWQARSLQLAGVACALCAGCALTDLDLDGGAKVISVRLPEQVSAGFMLAIDDSEPLELILTYDDGFEEAAPPKEVKWSLETTRVASVDGDVKLRGRGIGSSELVARYQSHSTTTMVTVFDYPKELEIRANDRNCTVGETLTYGLILRYRHGAIEDVAARATWTSDKPEVATVAAGVVTGLAAGKARISATLEMLSASEDVQVSTALSSSEAGVASDPPRGEFDLVRDPGMR